MITNSGILEAKIYHKRHQPVNYEFLHSLFFLALNLNDLYGNIKTKLFSINRLNLFSVFWKDYGFESFDDPKSYIFNVLKNAKLETECIEDILLISLPKVVGYSFNPTSFWLCFNKKKELCAVLAEVNNTFKERHGYLCFNKNLSPIKKTDYIFHKKILHVSPFCETKGYYIFSFDIDLNKMNITIDYYEKEKKKIISTSIRGTRKILSDRNLIKYFFKYHFMTLKVIFFIHYHALNLWIKKVPYFKKPSKPKIDIT